MEKHYKPSARRLRKSRQEGNIPKSQYLTQIIVFFAVVWAAQYTINDCWVRSRILLEYILLKGFLDPAQALSRSFILCVQQILTILAIGTLVAVVVELLQTRWLLEPALLFPKASRISPIAGVKKIFSNLRSVWLFLVKLFCVFSMAFCFFYLYSGRIMELILIPDREKMRVFREIFQSACTSAFLAFIPILALDYWLKYRGWFKGVAMSGEDLKQEYKEDEGDPMMRSARRAAHQELLMQDLIARVRRSKVIVVEKA